jgi:Ca2+-binding RTX toxin-like protein
VSMVSGSKFDEVLTGDAGDNVLDGRDGNDHLNGLGGNDLLIGGPGADVLDGGAGFDAASYEGSPVGVYINMVTGHGSYGDAQGDTLVNISDLIGSGFADSLSGDASDNWLYGEIGNDKLVGNGGDDVLIGGVGADALYGGAGWNAASYIEASAGVAVDLAAGRGTAGEALGDTLVQINDLVGSAFKDSLHGDNGENWLYGGNGDDALYGNGGDDVLNGGAGVDALYGGTGWNAASYAGASAGVAVDLAVGRGTAGEALGDTMVQISDVIGSGFKDSLHGDDGDNVLYGNAGDDALYGNGGNDTLRGGAGADTLWGGTGFNMASYVGSPTAVAVDLAGGLGRYGDAEGDSLHQITDLNGSDFNDSLTGNAGENWLYGGAGNDVLRGQAGDDVLFGGIGADTLSGGGGFDTVSYDGSSAAVAVNLATGILGAGDAEGDKLSQISGVIGSGFNDFLTGNAQDNWLSGGDGADLLVGGVGDDSLLGSAGADTLMGEAGNDVLNGGAGADMLYGGDGFNAASYSTSSAAVAVDLGTGLLSSGDAQGDKLYQITDVIGSGFNDFLTGNSGSNWLSGGAGSDLLSGGAGDDFLQGGAGADVLAGGAGADIFIYTDAADSGVAATTRDRIVDFHWDHDRIDLSDIDANAISGGNQAFTYIGTTAFGGVAGQLRYFADGGVLVVAGDLNGDRVADFTIAIEGGVKTLAASDFIL